MGMRLLVQGIEAVAKDYERRTRSTERRVGDALQLGAKVIRDAGLKLADTPFRRRGLWRNVQDTSRRFRVRGNSLVEARVNSSRTEAQVLAKAHITSGRSDAVKSVFGRTGKSKELVRKELWIKRGSSRSGNRSHKGHPDRTGLQRVSLAGGLSRFGGSRKRHIREWALPRGLDQRDTVRLRGEELRIIVLGPAVERNEKSILAHIHWAARKGMS